MTGGILPQLQAACLVRLLSSRPVSILKKASHDTPAFKNGVVRYYSRCSELSSMSAAKDAAATGNTHLVAV